jgi:NAD(P)H dehydrogenase (quinone)
MKVFVVYAHHEPKSFSASLKELAVSLLTGQGHQVKVSDLYAMKFKAPADRDDFLKLDDPGYMNYLMQERSASAQKTFVKNIVEEQAKVTEADFLLFNFPIWWFSAPAILKGWFDRVLATGFAWDFNKIYQLGLLRGKKAMVTVTTGGPLELYQPAGAHRATIEQILHPIIHGTLHFCGLDVLPPFAAYAVFTAGDDGRKKYLEQYRQRILSLETAEPLLKHQG